MKKSIFIIFKGLLVTQTEKNFFLVEGESPTLIILQYIIMTDLKKVKSHPDVVDYFQEVPFYNKHIKKPKLNA